MDTCHVRHTALQLSVLGLKWQKVLQSEYDQKSQTTSEGGLTHSVIKCVTDINVVCTV